MALQEKLYKEMIINLFTDVSLPVHLHTVKCLLQLLVVWVFKCFVERGFFGGLFAFSELVKL